MLVDVVFCRKLSSRIKITTAGGQNDDDWRHNDLLFNNMLP